MKKKIKQDIKDNNIKSIISDINEINMDLTKIEECFDELVGLLFSSSNDDITSAIDWCFVELNKSVNAFDYAIKIIQNKSYSFNFISKKNNVRDFLFRNNNISTKLYLELIKDTFKYRMELIQLIDNVNIDFSLIVLSPDEKVDVFYKTMGLTTYYVKKAMYMCLSLLKDDDCISNKDIALIFGRFYGWNYIKNSSEFLKEVKPSSNHQKELVEMLDAFVTGYYNQYQKDLSKDFNINNDILSARRRLDSELNKKMNEDAEKKSIFYSLFHRVNILFGDRVAFSVDDKFGDTEFNETKMSKFEVEYEIPLDYLFNRIDYNHTINFLLNGGKDEAYN